MSAVDGVWFAHLEEVRLEHCKGDGTDASYSISRDGRGYRVQLRCGPMADRRSYAGIGLTMRAAVSRLLQNRRGDRRYDSLEKRLSAKDEG